MSTRNFYLPTLAEWRAFLCGVREFRLSVTTSYPEPESDSAADLPAAYDCGREFAHWATFRRFEV